MSCVVDSWQERGQGLNSFEGMGKGALHNFFNTVLKFVYLGTIWQLQSLTTD